MLVAVAIVLAVLALLAANQLYVRRVRAQLQRGQGEDAATATQVMRDQAAVDASDSKYGWINQDPYGNGPSLKDLRP